MYVVAGVSGNTGSVVAQTLLDRKVPVKVIVRSLAKGETWRAKGAQVAVASLDDPQALTEALRGAKGAYLLSPPDAKSPDLLGERLITSNAAAAAVAASGLPHVVFLSSVGAQHPAGTGPVVVVHRAEQKLSGIGRATTFVRAASFLENLAMVLPVVKSQGVLPTFAPLDYPVEMVSVRDIGRTAAQALLDGPRSHRIIELAGPKPFSAKETAAILSELLGKTITAVQSPLDSLVSTFTSMGVSPAVAGLFKEMYEGSGKGLLAFEGAPRAEFVRGTVTAKEGLGRLLGLAA